MLLTVVVIVVATIAVAALEVWLFWLAGKQFDRRRAYRRHDAPSPGRTTHLRSRRRPRGLASAARFPLDLVKDGRRTQV
jgi:hypothetical protein